MRSIVESSPRSSEDDDPPVRLVIADDAGALRTALRRLAQVDGRFEVVAEAADGRSAIEIILRVRPDAVLLDVRMPGVDGLAVITELKRSELDTRIVMYSNDDGARAEALARGADAWHDKGAAFSEVAATLLALTRGDADTDARRDR